LISVGSEGSDVHLLGLGAELFLVLEDGLDDEVVATSDRDHRENVVGNSCSQDVGLVVGRLRNVIVRAGSHDTVHGVSSPSDQGADRPAECPDPAHHDDGNSSVYIIKLLILQYKKKEIEKIIVIY